MLTIKLINKKVPKAQNTIQSVANIEAIIQPQDTWSYQTIMDLLAQDSIDLFVVYKKDKVVGYCLYQVVFEQAEILRIGTHPDYQRQGVASQLFTVLNKQLQACKVETLLLEVRADNDPAIALYEQHGFTVIHRRSGYYQQPRQPAIDALIMQKLYSSRL